MDFNTLDMLLKCGKEFRHTEIRGFGLTETESLICSFIYRHTGCSQDDVVRGLRIDKTTAAKAMLTLEEKGLLEREQAAEDRRKKRLRLTEDGAEKISSVLDLHDAWLREVLTCLTEAEQAQFEAYCHRLYRRAEEMLTERNGTGEGK